MKFFIDILPLKMPFFVLSLVCFLISSGLLAQTQDAYRDKNWHPETGEYYFSEVMVWEYLNENNSPDETELHSGEFSVYVDPPTGTMLFTPEAYGYSGEMINFVIVFQDGRYFQGFTDEFGEKKCFVDTLYKFESTQLNQGFIKDDFDKLAKPTGKYKTFGENIYGWQKVRAKGYELVFLKTCVKSTIYLSEQPYSLMPIYLFNELESEAKLPINFDFSQIIPLEYWVVEDSYKRKSAESKREIEVRTTLKFISPTEYFVDLSDYQLLK